MEMYDSDFQGFAVMNYPDVSVPFTRITEHKYFSPWENHSKSIIFKEYSRNCEKNDIPYYPIRLLEEKNTLRKYVSAANDEKHVSFIGRLGTYRYLDMDVTIKEAINASNIIIQKCKNGVRIPVFFNDPI
jgi:UDP-galactopyranose mutase